MPCYYLAMNTHNIEMLLCISFPENRNLKSENITYYFLEVMLKGTYFNFSALDSRTYMEPF